MALLGCSSGEPVQPDFPDSAAPTTAESDGDGAVQATDSGTSSTTGAADVEPVGPTLADEDLAEIVELAAGEQIEDAQGNLISIYGFAQWPRSFANLPTSVRGTFPFVVDVDTLGNGSTLLVLDVGMCTAGLNAEGFGTVEFFLHADRSEPLASATDANQTIVTRHPVISPGFSFPPIGECERGWLPMIWQGEGEPGAARYLLSNRSSSAAQVEQHLYQWQVAEVAPGGPVKQFSTGEQVTFNDGALVDTEVTVQGWAELVGQPTSIEGTRAVAVSLSYCAAGDRLPEFGMGADGWNLIAPRDPEGDGFGPVAAGECAEGWLEFAVPHGAVPTSFFASDFRDPIIGYAEWSLDNAALAPPTQQ